MRAFGLVWFAPFLFSLSACGNGDDADSRGEAVVPSPTEPGPSGAGGTPVGPVGSGAQGGAAPSLPAVGGSVAEPDPNPMPGNGGTGSPTSANGGTDGDHGGRGPTAAGGPGLAGSGGTAGTPTNGGGGASAGTGAGGTANGGSTAGGGGTGGASAGSSGNGGSGSPPGAGCTPPGNGSNPNRVCIKGKNYYLNGINVAWNQWTADLTNYDANAFESMFATLEASGGNAIRWWWFIDGENQVTFSGNLAQPLAPSIFDNLDAAFDAAAEHGVLIMPVFLSFDIEGVREFLVTDEAATRAFVDNVVTPLVERYDAHPGLGLWEILNEGDWLLTSEMGSVSLSDYQRFHALMAAGIHAADPDALVTTGSASFKYLGGGDNVLSDATLQAAAGGDPLARLDVYQTHYYGWMHGDGWSYEPWIRTSTEWQGDGKPILIGEFPCRGEEGRWSTLDMHVESVNQGYAGTFCWAYFDNRQDDEGTWNDARPGIEAIAAQIPGAIVGE